MWKISGTDLNATTALLHLWWGLLEAPAGTDLSPRLHNLFSDNIAVEWHGQHYEGRSSIIAMLCELPRSSSVAHHLVSIEMDELADGDFDLQVELVHQTQDPVGQVESHETRHRYVLQRTTSGALAFKHITMPTGRAIAQREFSSTTMLNRAKATVIEFQTHVDRLDGTADGLERLITQDATFHGLMATSEPLSGIEGLSAWLAAGPATFRWVRHNQLLSFSLSTLDQGRYEATATFEWLAETHSGERIERRTPVRWTLVETNDTFMKIDRIN